MSTTAPTEVPADLTADQWLRAEALRAAAAPWHGSRGNPNHPVVPGYEVEAAAKRYYSWLRGDQ